MVNGYAPASLQEALEIRAGQDVTPYAGGTDLMVKRRPDAQYLFIGRLPELRRITEDESFIRIGAAVTFTEALADPRVPPLMKAAVSRIGSPAIRNAGTFGGNIGNASAKADSVPVELAADAKLRLVSLRGERILEIEDFYHGHGTHDLGPDELIAEILLPRTGLDHWYYEKVGGRSALAISRISFAGVFDMREDRITKAAAAFGAVSDTVLRFRDLEAMLIGRSAEEARLLKPDFLRAYDERLQLTEGRVSARYRKGVCLKLLENFLSSFGI